MDIAVVFQHRKHRSEFICNLLDGVHVGFSISLISRAEIIWYAPTTKGHSQVRSAMAVRKTMRTIPNTYCARPTAFLHQPARHTTLYHTHADNRSKRPRYSVQS